jgi:hypothetical protein
VDYAANDTLQIRNFFTCAVRLYQLGIIGSIEITVFFDKAIVQEVQVSRSSLCSVCFSASFVQVDITVPYSYVGFGSCFL